MTLQHNTRDRIPQNADPQRASSNWTKGGNTLECVARFDGLMPEKIRKNAVLAVELVLTASPDFSGDWTKYLTACDKWAMQTFGIGHEKNDVRPVVHIAHHRDEETPHTHITIVPLKDGKLNAKHFIGGSRDRMAELQNDFFEKVGKEFGLDRGQSRAETRTRHNPHTLADKAADLEKREKVVTEITKYPPKEVRQAVSAFQELKTLTPNSFRNLADRIQQENCATYGEYRDKMRHRMDLENQRKQHRKKSGFHH